MGRQSAPEVSLSMPALRVVGRLAALVGCAAGCAAAPRLAPLTISPGCYAVTPDNWPPAVVAETGLNSLPSFVGLDTAVAGPRGRRVIAPTTWASAAPEARSAYWTEEPHGDRPSSLVLIFQGPAGDFVASLEESPDGYAGAGVALGRRGAGRMPQVQVTLVAVTCAGLKLAAPTSAP
jgi:hypothetical protein